jgi:hypothetical protein
LLQPLLLPAAGSANAESAAGFVFPGVIFYGLRKRNHFYGKFTESGIRNSKEGWAHRALMEEFSRCLADAAT